MPARDHLEVAALAGNAPAIALLEGPPCPVVLRYLLEWVSQLHGRSGFTMSGRAPMTWATLDAWARWTGSAPDPADVDALFELDAVMLNPGELKAGPTEAG